MANVFNQQRTIGITATPEFEKKKLATHALNVGTLCGHQCCYCSTPSVMRRNPIFKKLGMTSQQAFEKKISVVDPWTSIRACKSAQKLTPNNRVMLSTLTDPYSPEAQKHDLGKKCSQAVLEYSQANLRILTKNAKLAKDLEYLTNFNKRVQVGLSITAPPEKESIINLLEPNASTIKERLSVYEKAAELGLQTYGMLCPCIPGIANGVEDIHSMMTEIVKFNPESIWLEPLNPRGNGIDRCVETLNRNGHESIASEIAEVKDKRMHDLYTMDLIDNTTEVARELGCVDKLKILVYSDGDGFSCEDRCVIWLKQK